MRYFFMAIVILVIDQWSKWLVMSRMSVGESIPVIEEVFYFTSHRNAGAAFGILQNQRWFFIIVTIVVVIGVVYYLLRIKNEKKLMAVALAFILGGALGNFIDRLRMGEVVDFFDVDISIGHFFYDFPIFNIADTALVIGVGLIIIDMIIDSINERKERESA